MNILNFDDLLQAARAQPEAQRLLFVFTGAELPENSSPAQQERFHAGEGGSLVPLMCVDKLPDELTCFAALAQESNQFGHTWSLVFAAALSGSMGQIPTTEEADEPLQRMVESIKEGKLGDFISFDTQGQSVQLE
jgi:hypothetical protein